MENLDRTGGMFGQLHRAKDTLKDILAIKFVGNYAADSMRFKRIDDFCMRADVAMADKRTALDFASKEGMGIESNITVEEVEEHLSMIKNFLGIE